MVPKPAMSATRPGQPNNQMVANSQELRRRIMSVPSQQQQQAPTPGWKTLPPPSTPMTPFQQQQRKFTHILYIDTASCTYSNTSTTVVFFT